MKLLTMKGMDLPIKITARNVDSELYWETKCWEASKKSSVFKNIVAAEHGGSYK